MIHEAAPAAKQEVPPVLVSARLPLTRPSALLASRSTKLARKGFARAPGGTPQDGRGARQPPSPWQVSQRASADAGRATLLGCTG